MVRDTTEGKINYMLIRPGPMLKRWAAHLSRAASKYDNTRKPGEPRNWQLARGLAEFERFQESAARHFEQWLNGDRDEDHAAGVFFNINGAEYVLEQLQKDAGKSAEASCHDVERVSVASDFRDCANKGPDGWFCELEYGHCGEHWFPHEKYDTTASPTWPNSAS